MALAPRQGRSIGASPRNQPTDCVKRRHVFKTRTEMNCACYQNLECNRRGYFRCLLDKIRIDRNAIANGLSEWAGHGRAGQPPTTIVVERNCC
jgi:hypothetical protein